MQLLLRNTVNIPETTVGELSHTGDVEHLDLSLNCKKLVSWIFVFRMTGIL